jgi:hypothetical protein
VTIAGSYTACRTVGGSKGGRILKLGFHLDRLCSSLRLLFPDLDLDGLEISPAEDESPCAASDSISLVDVPAKDALLVLFGGESRSGGQCAAEQLSLQLVQRCPGATMMSMAGLNPDVLANHSGACAIIRELPSRSLFLFLLLFLIPDGNVAFHGGRSMPSTILRAYMSMRKDGIIVLSKPD